MNRFFGPGMFSGTGFLGAGQSGGWTPDSEAGLLVWLDASDAGSRTMNGSIVSTWTNKGSLGGNMVNVATPNEGPVLLTAEQNGLDVIQTGSQTRTDQLQHESAILNETNLTILAVVQDIDNVTTSSVHTILDAQEQSGSFNGPSLQTYNDFAGQAGQRQVFGSGNGATVVLYKNGVTSPVTLDLSEWAVAGGTFENLSALSSSGAPFTMGVNGSLSISSSMNFGEVLVYDRVLDTETLALANDYLSTKWGIPPAGDWTPASEPGLLVWLDPSDADTVTLSGSVATAITNKGSLGGTMNATPTPTGPILASAAPSGLNVLEFLDSPTCSYISDSNIISLTDATALTAVQCVDPVQAILLNATDVGGNGPTWGQADIGDGHPRAFAGGAGAVITTYKNGQTDPVTVVADEWLVAGVTWAGLSSVPDPTQLIIGTTSNMKLGEYLIYDHVLDATTLAAANTYLSQKWGV